MDTSRTCPSAAGVSAEQRGQGGPGEREIRAGEARRIVLVGLMGSGKSSLGRRLARALDWAFIDVDDEVVRRTGRRIADIFERDGEPAFREIEHGLTTEMLGREAVVIASGGGWPCRDDRLEALPAGTLSVWLQVSVEGALKRIGRPGDDRPLLDVANRRETMERLIGDRERHYRKAMWWVDTSRVSPGDAVRQLVEGLETDFGRPLRI